MRTPSPKFTPNWKEIILASPDWPEDLSIPQNDSLPEDSECILESMNTNEHWEWELWRHPDGHCYYLKVWPMNEGEHGNRRGRLLLSSQSDRKCHERQRSKLLGEQRAKRKVA